ncbi:DUF3221 domain-containing protein [Paenibacillus lentus]|nr:DUF3221 domain-containing protein [Paenibacillus lentus]
MWNYDEGYVVAKDEANLMILVVKNHVTDLKNKSIEKIIEEADPNAIWITTDRATYDSILIGDHVKIKDIGTVLQSYPGQTKGKVTKME